MQGCPNFLVQLKWGEGRMKVLSLLWQIKIISSLFPCHTCHFPFDLHLDSKDFYLLLISRCWRSNFHWDSTTLFSQRSVPYFISGTLWHQVFICLPLLITLILQLHFWAYLQTQAWGLPARQAAMPSQTRRSAERVRWHFKFRIKKEKLIIWIASQYSFNSKTSFLKLAMKFLKHEVIRHLTFGCHYHLTTILAENKLEKGKEGGLGFKCHPCYKNPRDIDFITLVIDESSSQKRAL